MSTRCRTARRQPISNRVLAIAPAIFIVRDQPLFPQALDGRTGCAAGFETGTAGDAFIAPVALARPVIPERHYGKRHCTHGSVPLAESLGGFKPFHSFGAFHGLPS